MASEHHLTHTRGGWYRGAQDNKPGPSQALSRERPCDIPGTIKTTTENRKQKKNSKTAKNLSFVLVLCALC